MNSPKISIIVPVYKVEKYLRRCLDSILAQTFSDWECILIDDGSPDDSGKICDEYVEKDERFRVFHQENRGVSAARNKGLDEVRGEWIGFVDSDDWVSNDYFTIDYENTDVIQKKIYGTKDYSQQNISQNEYYYFFVEKRRNTIWDKIFHIDIISNKRFDVSVKIGEDFLFLLSLTPNIKKYSFSNTGYYCYENNENSAMHSIKNALERMIVIENNIEHINNIIQEPLYFKESIIYKTYLRFFIQNKSILTIPQKKLLKKMIDNFKFNYLKYLSLCSKLKTYYYLLCATI